jgi:hypothetical protein
MALALLYDYFGHFLLQILDFYYKFWNSTNMSFINVFILPNLLFSSTLTEASDTTCIASSSLGRGYRCGIGPIKAPEFFFLFKGLGGNNGEISCEDWDGLSPCQNRVRTG